MSENRRTPNEPAGHSPHRRMLIVLGALAALVATLFVQHHVLKGRADQLLEQLKAQGHPTNLNEVNDAYTIRPGATNAADAYQAAISSLIPDNRADTNGPAHFKLESPIDAYPENVLRFVESWVGTNETAIAKLHQASLIPHCRFPIDYTAGFNTLLPHLAPIRNTMRLLTWQSYLLAESGEIDAALDSLQVALAAGASTRGEPDIIAQLVRIAGTHIVFNRLEEILNRRPFSDAQLKRLFGMLEGRESMASLRSGFAGEMCMGLDFFENPDAYGGLNLNGPVAGGDRFKDLAAISGLKASGLWERDRSFYIQLLQGFLNALDRPFPEALSASKEADARLDGSKKGIRNIGTHAIAPALSQVIAREASRVACLRLSLSAIAVERFRLARNGRVPDALDELAPEFLPSTFEDPFDGNPLRYRKLDKGYVIWSLGQDLEDNQGDLKPEGKRSKDQRFRMMR